MDSDAARTLLRDLAEWRPDGGVLSVYLDIDPADRRESWRVRLRDELAGVDDKLAQRVLARFPENAAHPEGRTQIGFVEAGGGGREVWNGFQVNLGEVRAALRPAPLLEPLVRILDDNAAVGIVLTSLERVRVLEWALGRVEGLADWELVLTSGDWRERRSPSRNPQSDGTGTTAAGREQQQQRLEHNRERFLKQAGGLVASRFGGRDWRRILVVGEGDRPRLLAAGLGPKAELVHELRHDLISAPAAEIAARVEGELEHLNREREEELLRRVEEAIGTDSGAALGPDEVLAALEQGRVGHLILDGEREFEERDGVPLGERMIALALTTSADVTPVEGMAAQAVSARGGAVALLRY